MRQISLRGYRMRGAWLGSLTQRALRRTFNDLARTAQVSDLVTRSINGRLTERMQQHYSTVNAAEQGDAVAKVIRLFDPKAPTTSAPSGEGKWGGTPRQWGGYEKSRLRRPL
jgi:hypothetical protein